MIVEYVLFHYPDQQEQESINFSQKIIAAMEFKQNIGYLPAISIPQISALIKNRRFCDQGNDLSPTLSQATHSTMQIVSPFGFHIGLKGLKHNHQSQGECLACRLIAESKLALSKRDYLKRSQEGIDRAIEKMKNRDGEDSSEKNRHKKMILTKQEGWNLQSVVKLLKQKIASITIISRVKFEKASKVRSNNQEFLRYTASLLLERGNNINKIDAEALLNDATFQEQVKKKFHKYQAERFTHVPKQERHWAKNKKGSRPTGAGYKKKMHHQGHANLNQKLAVQVADYLLNPSAGQISEAVKRFMDTDEKNFAKIASHVTSILNKSYLGMQAQQRSQAKNKVKESGVEIINYLKRIPGSDEKIREVEQLLKKLHQSPARSGKFITFENELDEEDSNSNSESCEKASRSRQGFSSRSLKKTSKKMLLSSTTLQGEIESKSGIASDQQESEKNIKQKDSSNGSNQSLQTLHEQEICLNSAKKKSNKRSSLNSNSGTASNSGLQQNKQVMVRNMQKRKEGNQSGPRQTPRSGYDQDRKLAGRASKFKDGMVKERHADHKKSNGRARAREHMKMNESFIKKVEEQLKATIGSQFIINKEDSILTKKKKIRCLKDLIQKKAVDLDSVLLDDLFKYLALNEENCRLLMDSKSHDYLDNSKNSRLYGFNIFDSNRIDPRLMFMNLNADYIYGEAEEGEMEVNNPHNDSLNINLNAVPSRRMKTPIRLPSLQEQTDTPQKTIQHDLIQIGFKDQVNLMVVPIKRSRKESTHAQSDRCFRGGKKENAYEKMMEFLNRKRMLRETNKTEQSEDRSEIKRLLLTQDSKDVTCIA